MSLVDRATKISLHPQAEWPVIAAEPNSFAGIFTRYVAPLAAIGPVSLVVGLSIVGVGIPFVGTYRTPLVTSVTQGVLTFVLILAGVAIMSAIAGALAPHFGGRRDAVSALKLVGYAYTPAFIAGVLGLFPPLSFLEIFAALWTLYIFYRGAPTLALSAYNKALPYTATCVACGIVLGFAGMLLFGAIAFTTGAFAHPGLSATGSDAEGRAIASSIVGSALGGGSANEQSAQKMVDAVASAGADADRARASGDADAQVQAGVKALSAIVRGGKDAVTPIERDRLASLLPDAAAGLARSASDSQSGALAGIAASSADATYGNAGTGTIVVSVADLGNVGGLAAIANLATTLQAESESDSGFEKNIEVDGRKAHVKWTNAGKQSDVLEIVDDRLAIDVTASGVELESAIAALRGVDVTKFQALAAATGK
jgi:hypothetical protein